MQRISILSVRPWWYMGWRRILVHVLFWLLIYSYEALQTSFIVRDPDLVFIGVTLREVATLMLIHYFFSYYVIPRLLLRARWASFLISVGAAYVFMVFSLYYGLYFLRSHGLMPAYIAQFADFYLRSGFLAALTDPIRIYNTVVFFSTLFSTLLIKTTVDLLSSSEQKLKLEREKSKLEKENLMLELDLLKSQINPHFFFNTLNNIYSLVEDKDELAASIIVRLSDMMRYSLYESNHNTIPLGHELRFICNYVELEKIRRQDYVKINLDIQDYSANLNIPPLILITFVENAFKHGVKNTIGASWVNIKVSVSNKELSFLVQNSKPEKISYETVKGGIGLVNVQRRLELLYPGRHRLTIRNESDQYQVDLQIQLYEAGIELHHSGRRAVGSESYREVY